MRLGDYNPVLLLNFNAAHLRDGIKTSNKLQELTAEITEEGTEFRRVVL